MFAVPAKSLFQKSFFLLTRARQEYGLRISALFSGLP